MEKATIPKPQVHANLGYPPEEECQAALAVSPLFGRVHRSVLWVVTKIFAASKDGRVKKGGCFFLAHLLRFSVIDQLSLFPGTEICDVAKISIPNIKHFCFNKQQNGWPWCYDTTLKYLNLLTAAGILVTRSLEHGIYYLPLGACTLLPEHAGKQIEKLAKKRPKVSQSAALTRTAVHCTLQGMASSPSELRIGESSKQDALVLDEHEMQRAVQAICATVQRCQGVALLPTTMVELTRVFVEHTPRVLKKSSGKLFMRSKEDSLQLASASSAANALVDRQEMGDSREDESTTSDPRVKRPGAGAHKNLSSGDGRKRERAGESTSSAPNLLASGEIVDSAHAVLSEFTPITRKKDSLSEATLSEHAGTRGENWGQESTTSGHTRQMVDSSRAGETGATSPVPLHPLVDTFSLSTLLFWRFPEEAQELEHGMTIQSHLAALLSDRFEGNASRVPHYMALLGQDIRALDLAIVDSLVRSSFPDPRHRPNQLGGGWITRQYKAYREGSQVPAEILAWANTTYTYERLKAALAEVARRQDAQGQPRTRPLPREVIVDSSALEDFWTHGAASGLTGQGYLYVDLDGDLLTCQEYEQRRRASLEEMVATDPLALSPEVEDEVATYLDWIMPWVCDAEEEARLLENLPNLLQRYLNTLGQVLDSQHYVMNVHVAPLSHHRVIAVHVRRDPRQAWLLPSGCDVEAFLREYKRSLQFEEGAGEPSPEESTSFSTEEEPYSKETGSERMETRADLKVGPYAVNFDEEGATIEHEETLVLYRLDAATATNTVDFVQIHGSVVMAMGGNAPEGLESYRVERRTGEVYEMGLSQNSLETGGTS